MKKHLVLLVPLLFLMAQCHKPPTPEPNTDPDLPPITQEGKGTIGCYINGKPWVPEPYICIGCIRYLDVSYNANSYYSFVLKSNNFIKDKIDQYLQIYVRNSIIGYNKIDYDSGGLGIFSGSTENNFLENKVYFLDTTQMSFLRLNKIDSQKNIISGEFEFTALSGDKKDTIKVTKGRFDTVF